MEWKEGWGEWLCQFALFPGGCLHSSSSLTQTPRHKVQPTAAKCQEAGREERMFPVGDLRIAFCLGV